MKLTEKEKQMIISALEFVYDTKLAQLSANKKIISLTERNEILKTANEYFDLTDKIGEL